MPYDTVILIEPLSGAGEEIEQAIRRGLKNFYPHPQRILLRGAFRGKERVPNTAERSMREARQSCIKLRARLCAYFAMRMTDVSGMVGFTFIIAIADQQGPVRLDIHPVNPNISPDFQAIVNRGVEQTKAKVAPWRVLTPETQSLAEQLSSAIFAYFAQALGRKPGDQSH